MAPPSPRELLLFVSGEPGPGPDPGRDVVSSMPRRLLGTVIPTAWFHPGIAGGGTPPSLAPEDDWSTWHLSREATACVDMVLDVAEKEGRTVSIINANDPREHADLVRRWIGPEDLFPILVRPDGRRLVGEDEFSPGKIQRFVRW